MAKSTPYVASCWVYSIVSHSIQIPTCTQETNYHIKDQIEQKQRSQFVDRFCVRVGTRIFRFSVYVNN